jgi:hypothetical protein
MTKRTRQGDTLLLATGELLDFARAEAVEFDLRERFGNAVLDLLARSFAFFEPEGDILRDVEMRPERVALKHHARAAFVRGQAGHVLVIEPDLASIRRVKPGDVAQQRGFAAAARSE